MERTSSKNIVLWVILLFIIVLSSIGISFSFFVYTRTSNVAPTIQTGTAELGYVEESNGISLTNALPTSDVNALNTTDESQYFDFYVNYNFSGNVNVSYEIDIENTTSNLDEVKNGTLTALLSSRIKVALEDRTVTLPNEPLVVNATYFSELELTNASNGKAGHFLYSRTASGRDTHYYRLYMWIPEVDDQNIGIPLVDMNSVQGIRNQAFSIRINVQAVVSVK